MIVINKFSDSLMTNISSEMKSFLFSAFYRIITDRIYEKYHHMHDNITFFELNELRFEDSFFSPAISLKVDSISLIGTVFQNNELFSEIASILFQCCLVNSPIDSLFYVNQAENKLAIVSHYLSNTKSNHLPDPNDIAAMRVGIFLAADLPNLNDICQNCNKFLNDRQIHSQMLLMKNHLSAILDFFNEQKSLILKEKNKN